MTFSSDFLAQLRAARGQSPGSAAPAPETQAAPAPAPLPPRPVPVPSTPPPPPAALVEAMREHRAALLRQVQEGRLPDGRLDVAALSALPGRCGSCARWQGPDAYGDGLCPLGRAAHGWHDGNPKAPVLTTPHHKCAAHGGAGWKAKGRA